MQFILFADHGYHLGEKQRWSKFSLWERTTRVPFIVSVPGYTPGKSAKPIELLSIYPTLVELCGLPTNPDLEGVSVAPLMKAPNSPWPHVAVSTLGQNNHAVRDERWRYIRYADGSEELYDHQCEVNYERPRIVAGNSKYRLAGKYRSDRVLLAFGDNGKIDYRDLSPQPASRTTSEPLNSLST